MKIAVPNLGTSPLRGAWLLACVCFILQAVIAVKHGSQDFVALLKRKRHGFRTETGIIINILLSR